MIDLLFAQYSNYPLFEIILELTAVFFGLWSVWCAKKNNIWVFPTGIISTIIYVYLLWQWSLLGDMIINGYFFIMSIYGWYLWGKKNTFEENLPITKLKNNEILIGFVIFILTELSIISIYIFFNKFTNWFSYLDTFITGIFFVGMWLMAKKKIENWILWIIGDFISIPLYFYKGYTFTSIQYIVFTIVAIYGYLEWKTLLNKKNKL